MQATTTPKNKLIEKIQAITPGLRKRAGWVTREEARKLVSEGAARWTNRCKAIELNKRDDMPVVDDDSCRMGPHVIEANADQIPWAMAVTSGWAPSAA